jgi:hypothetical protein
MIMTDEYLRDRIDTLEKSVRRKKDKIETLTIKNRVLENVIKNLENKINKEKQ